MAAAHVTHAPCVVDAPEGGLPAWGFGVVQDLRNAEGALLGVDYFAVPAEDYQAGWDRGEQAAEDCLRWCAAKGTPGVLFDVMMGAALVLAEDRHSVQHLALEDVAAAGPDRRGAAAGFLRTVERYAALGFARGDA